MCTLSFSLSKSASSTALDISEVALLGFGLLLVAGLIGEYAKSERWKKHVRVFEMFVIIGVAGELLADGGIFLFSRHLQIIADLEIADAAKEAVDAKTSARGAADASSRAKSSADAAGVASGEAQQKAGDIAKQADALTHRMESASSKLSELEQQVLIQGPRWRLLEDNKATFIEALKPFAGQRFTVVICGVMSAPEPQKLEQDLINFLGKEGAGWGPPGYTRWTRCPIGGATSVGGNLITFSSAASDAVKNSAKALGDALNKLTISTVTLPTPPGAHSLDLEFFGPDSPWELAVKDPTAVFLLVGTNPMFDLAGTKRHK
jgi:hypothetical protein